MILNPDIIKRPFTKLEDELLLKNFIEKGPKWKNISLNFINRSENMIKNRYNSHIKQLLKLKV